MDGENVGKAIHVALFTDGEDGHGLVGAIASGEGYLRTMATHPMLWVHCIGICSGIDCKLLSSIAETARRGTFQYVVGDNISRLMGSMWGLMVEAVDCTCSLSISMHGDSVRKDVLLRVCDPPISCFVAMPMVKKDTPCITATLTVGSTAKTWMRDLGKSNLSGQVDDVCVQEYAAEAHAKCNILVAEALGVGDLDKADEANVKACEEIKALASETLSEPVALFVGNVITELEAQSRAISYARVNEELARELEARTMSSASTARNQGMSIDPNGRTLSELQSQLSM